MTREVPLSKGYVAIVDDDFVLDRKWHAHISRGNYPYAARKLGGAKKELMHRLIIAAPAGMEVDHINGNTLDNRRCNLRLATKSQNQVNQPLSTRNTSGFRGVYWTGKYWRAKLKINGVQHYFGSFHEAPDAARAYDKAALEAFGEFARLNFPS